MTTHTSPLSCPFKIPFIAFAARSVEAVASSMIRNGPLEGCAWMEATASCADLAHVHCTPCPQSRRQSPSALSQLASTIRIN